MKRKIKIFVIALAIISSSTAIMAQTWTYTAPYFTTGYPVAINGNYISGSINTGDSLAVGVLQNGTGMISITHGLNRNAIFGTNQVVSDILFVNKVSSTYDYYERMRINRFGRVGIGTPAPDTSALLHVSATNKGVLIPSVALTATNDAATISLPAKGLLVWNPGSGGLTPEGYWYNAGTSSSPNWIQIGEAGWSLLGNGGTTPGTLNFIGTTDNKDWVIKTNNLERMRVLAGGNIGIGTSSPGGTLSIVSTNTTGATASSSLNITANNLTTGTAAYASSSSITSGKLLDLSISGTTGANNQRALNISLTGAHSASSISTYGGVIINGHSGTTSTNFGLYLEAKDAATNYAVFARATGTNASNIGLYSTVSGGTSNYNLYLNTLAAGPNNYSLYSPALAKSYFAGNVGIGTPNPSKLLHIASGGNFTFDPTPVTSSYTTEFVMDNTGLKIGHDGTSHDIRLLTNSTARITILHGGYVGIGTTTPSAKLEVNGTSEFNNDITVTGDINGTGSFNYTSDQMFKKEIDSISNALSIIQELKPRTYYFDTLNFSEFNFSSKKRYGFIAQDLEQVLPELVKQVVKHADYDTLGNIVHPETTFKTVNYIEIIAILTKGIQELEYKNDNLQSKVNNQDSINFTLQENNTVLQNQINNFVANGNIVQNQLNQLLDRVNNCCNAPTRSIQIGSSETQSEPLQQTDIKLSDIQSVVLEQNVPNPFAEQTTINYVLPDNTVKAQMLFYNSQGKLIQSTELTQKGSGQLNVFASDLSNGIYTYTLVVDDRIVDSKKMIRNK